MHITVTEAGVAPIELQTTATEVILGRSPKCDIVVDRPFVSARHLRILGGVVVHDMGSTNGSFIDGVPLERPEWLGGRAVTVGGEEVAVRVTGGDTGHSTYATDAVEVVTPTPVPAPVPRALPCTEGESALLLQLIEDDCRDVPAQKSGTLTDFFTLESFRFLRDVESIVSRMAGELAGRSLDETILPNTAGNVMQRLADVAVAPDDTYAREQLTAYLTELKRWLLESVTAYQRASVRLIEDLRASLGPMQLAKNEPVPRVHKVLGLHEIVLWKRAQEALRDLTPDVIAERLDELAREAARG